MPRRARISIGIKAGAGVAAGLIPIAGLITPHALSPAQLLNASLAAARAQTSVQWTSSGSEDGESLTIKTNAGRTTGIQVISITKGGSSGTIVAEVIKDTGYVKGNSFSLHLYLGFKPSAARKEANRWLSLAPSNEDYSGVTAGLTLKSVTSELEMTGPLTATPRVVILGERVEGVKGMSKPQPGGVPAFKTVLYVRAAGTPLPVEQSQVYEGHTTTVSLNKWNESVVLQKPAGAVPLLASWLE